MTIDLQALKDEITNDVLDIYPPFVEANDAAIADVGNNKDDVAPRTVNNDTVDTGAIRGVTTFDGFDGLVTAKQAWFEWLTVNGVIPVNAETLQQLAGIPTANDSIWAVGERAEMNAAIAKLMQRIGSRAEELKDTIGVSSWTPSDVANARQLP